MTREFTRRQLPVHPSLVLYSNGSAIAQKRRLLTDYQSAVPPVTLPADKKTLLSK